jgi:cytochrome b6-f complex iron-sulfur subunit
LTEDNKQTRREFCAQACHGVAIAAVTGTLGASLEGCGSGGASPTGSGSGSALPLINATQSGGTVTLAIDAASPLAAVGSVALVQSPSGSLLVAHTAQDTFLAVSARCTHEGCTITRYASQTYICPCHGSQFSTSGRVLSGPATGQLTSFVAELSGGQLTIR